MRDLGTRIAIVGVSASGKSTLAKELARTTGLPVTHMDAIMWRPGWEYIGDEATVEQLLAASAEDSWIIEGYLSRGARAQVLERADTIIYLDYPRHVAALRYLARWWRHRTNPRPELPGCPEAFSFSFLWRVWAKKEAISLNEFLKRVEPNEKIVTLRSAKECSMLSAQPDT